MDIFATGRRYPPYLASWSLGKYRYYRGIGMGDGRHCFCLCWKVEPKTVDVIREFAFLAVVWASLWFILSIIEKE
jgi:hypothetical protein